MARASTPSVTGVRVQNYRNILDSKKVPLNKITTLIGKNESGKSSFLEAVAGFNHPNEYNDRSLCSFRELRPKEETPVVTLFFDINDIQSEMYDIDETTNLNNRIGPTEFSITKYADGSFELHGSPLIKEIYREYLQLAELITDTAEDMKKEIDRRNRSNMADELRRIKIALDNTARGPIEPCSLSWINKTFNHAEKVISLYTDSESASDWMEDYVVKIGSLISSARTVFYPIIPNVSHHYSYDLLSDSATISEMSGGKRSTFKNLLNIGGASVEDVKNTSGWNLDTMMGRVGKRAAGEMNRFWSQKNIGIDIKGGDSNELRVWIEDQSSDPTSQSQEEPLSERSAGFRWFLSFYINMTAESDVDRHNLVLLDEPGIHLHPKGKRDWLRTIEEMSDAVQIVYTSHSPYLIEKSYPARIRAIEIEEGQKEATITTNILESDGDTLEPLRRALGVGLGHSPFVSKRQIIVEGPSDYYLLAGVAVYYRKHLDRPILRWEEISVTPAGGAKKVPEKAVWFASEEISYAMLLDSDEEGRETRDAIESDYHTLEFGLNRTVMLRSEFADEDVHIEDMFTPELYVSCFNAVYSNLIDDFDRVEIENTGSGSWEINGEPHGGKNIAKCLGKIARDQHPYGEDHDVRKILVADELQQRLNRGDVKPEQLRSFDSILNDLRRATYYEK